MTAISRRWGGDWRKERPWRRNWSKMWMDAPSGRRATRIPEVSAQGPVLPQEVGTTSQSNWGDRDRCQLSWERAAAGKQQHSHTASSRNHAWSDIARFVSSVDDVTVH